MAGVYGPDLSNNNGRVDWQQLAAKGKPGFVYCKATEGTGFVDGFFHSHRLAAKHFGVPFGAYHFAHPGNSPVAEANHFLAVVGALANGDLRPVLDLETSKGETGASLVRFANAWIKQVETKLKLRKPPLLYSYPWYVGHLGGWPRGNLWIADLSHKPGASQPAAVLHQYTWTKTVPGVAGPCDYNYTASLAAIRA